MHLWLLPSRNKCKQNIAILSDSEDKILNDMEATDAFNFNIHFIEYLQNITGHFPKGTGESFLGIHFNKYMLIVFLSAVNAGDIFTLIHGKMKPLPSAGDDEISNVVLN